ncbi:MAG: TetR/AcrR family transcriptional regulator [Acidimicrobiales bacterium]
MNETDVSEKMPDGHREEESSRPLRADAQRNRRRILEAAEEIFAKDGLAVPVDAVAQRAGVGVGTLYRHFPTKEVLFEAIVLTKFDDLIAAAQVEDDEDPTEAFFGFLKKMADQVSLKRDLFDALAAAGFDVKSRSRDRGQQLQDSLDRLRQRAVEAGEVRADVSIEQIMGLVIGACRGVDRPDRTDPAPGLMVGVVCDGLRVRH